MRPWLGFCFFVVGFGSVRECHSPVFEEEAFFGGEEVIGGSDEGAEGGGHLEGDEEEDADPDS